MWCSSLVRCQKNAVIVSEHCSLIAMTTGGGGGPLDLFSTIKCLVQERKLVFIFWCTCCFPHTFDLVLCTHTNLIKPWLKILYLKPDRNYNGILAYIWNNIKYTETFGNFRKYAIISLLKIIFRVFSFIILIYTHIALYNVKQLHTLFKIMYLAYNWLRFITNSFEWWL